MNNHTIAANAQGAIPQFLRSGSDKFAGQGVALGQIAPSAPPSEVQREIDQLHMELGDLESIVVALNDRLAPVSHPSTQDSNASGVTANCSSHVGQQVSSGVYRVAAMAANLRALAARLAI